MGGGQHSPNTGDMMSAKNDAVRDVSQVQSHGEYKLQQRVSRLKRLVDLNAPVYIIAREIVLVQKAMWLLNPDAMASAISEDNVQSARHAAGFCNIPGCQNFQHEKNELCEPCIKENEDREKQERLEDPNLN